MEAKARSVGFHLTVRRPAYAPTTCDGAGSKALSRHQGRVRAMSARKPATDDKATTVMANPDGPKGVLKPIGGSQSDHWNNVLGNQARQSLWLKHSDKEARDRQHGAAIAGLIGIGPKDEIEGMIAAQLLAAHNASMECYRRAMIGEQTFESRRENLSQANKLSRTYAVLLEALNHHRGKGQQKVVVEHVHVHAGGQAVVGMVETMHRKLPMHLSRRCGARTRSGNRCQSPAMPNGRCRMHGGKSPGAPKGNKNAFKHGRYTAEAAANRREIAMLLRSMKALARTAE
jgi:hypothetical protein